jgi:multisubunit Na+/H+ antiporter MnhG subunit
MNGVIKAVRKGLGTTLLVILGMAVLALMGTAIVWVFGIPIEAGPIVVLVIMVFIVASIFAYMMAKSNCRK